MKISQSFDFFSTYNSLFFSAALIAGICWQSNTLNLFFLFVGASFLVFSSRYFSSQFPWACAAGFALGAIAFWAHTQRLSIDFSPFKDPFEAIVEEKQLTGNPHWPFKIRIRSLISPKAAFFIYTKTKPALEINDRIKCDIPTLKPPGAGNFKKYLYKEGAIATAFIKEFNPELLSKPCFSFLNWIEKKQEALFNKLKQKMPHRCFVFFSSLFMGDKARVKRSIEKQKNPFKQWGISHHLARSGLHLMLFVLVWHLLISFIPIRFSVKTVLMLFLSCIYFLLTPATISFVRAFELFLLYKLCALFNRQINSIHLLCLVCSATLLYNPFQLFFLDFQLSFYLTFCLAWLSHLGRKKRSLGTHLLPQSKKNV